MNKWNPADLISFILTILGGGFAGNVLSERRQNKKDTDTNAQTIIDQLQENSETQMKRIDKQEEKIEDLYNIINALQEELRTSKTKEEQANFWLEVEKETTLRLEKSLEKKEEENKTLREKNRILLKENERLRSEVSKLESQLNELRLRINQHKEEI